MYIINVSPVYTVYDILYIITNLLKKLITEKQVVINPS